MNQEMKNTVAGTVLGFVAKLTILDFTWDLFSALIFGIAGALGSYLGTILIKQIITLWENRSKTKKTKQ